VPAGDRARRGHRCVRRGANAASRSDISHERCSPGTSGRRCSRPVRPLGRGKKEHCSGCALEGIVKGAARGASCPASVLGLASQQPPRRKALRSRAREGSGLPGSHRRSAERATVVHSTTGIGKLAARRTGCSASESLLGPQQLAQGRVPRRSAGDVSDLTGRHSCSAERATGVRSASAVPFIPYGQCSSTSLRGMCSHTMLPAVRTRSGSGGSGAVAPAGERRGRRWRCHAPQSTPCQAASWIALLCKT